MDNQEALNRVLNEVRPKVKESVFRYTYLPLLMNNTDPTARVRWIREVAMVLTQEVDVVDDNDINTVLFWVPPVERSPKDVDPDFYDIDPVISERNRNFATWGHRADETMKRHLKGLIQPPKPAQRDIDQWQNILARYDEYKLHRPEKDEGGPSTSQGSETPEW